MIGALWTEAQGKKSLSGIYACMESVNASMMTLLPSLIHSSVEGVHLLT
jgi:hypothetical protein